MERETGEQQQENNKKKKSFRELTLDYESNRLRTKKWNQDEISV